MRNWLPLLLVVTGCLQPIQEPAPADAGQDVAPEPEVSIIGGDYDANARVAVDIVSDVVSPLCDPECPPWQTCKLAACVDKSCQADSECNAATPDPEAVPYYCYKGSCKGYQCANDADCGAGKLCNTFKYVCYDKPVGCTTTAMCDDKDSCTTDTCNADGNCSHVPIFACCHTAVDCEDKDDCTTDTCAGGQCSWAPKGVCCTSDKQCDDGKPCTQDLCNGGACTHKPAPGCCLSNAECDDGDASNQDSCVSGKCLHVWKGLATACPGGAGCTANNCASSTCVSNQCGYSLPPKLPGCCTQDSQCAKDVACTVDTCTALMCLSQKAQGSGTHVWARFDDSQLSAWKVEQSSKTVYFHYDTMSKVGGPGCLRYGVPGQVSFEDQTPNKGAAVSPTITLPKAPGLKFWALLDTSPGAGIHQCGVDVVDAASGAKLASVWSKNDNLGTGTTAAKWLPQSVAIPDALAGKQVKLRIWFDQVKWDTSNKQKLGFLIDELELTGACP